MAGERTTAILETRSETTGFKESTADAQALDSAITAVSITTKELSNAQISAEGSFKRLQGVLDPTTKLLNNYQKQLATIAAFEEQKGASEATATARLQAAAAYEAALQRLAGGANDNTAALGRMTTAQNASAEAAQAQVTAMQAQVNAWAGMRDVGSNTAALIQHGQALDALRAKLSPLFAAEQELARGLIEANGALEQGAINFGEYDSAIRRTEATFQTAAASVRKYYEELDTAAKKQAALFQKAIDTKIGIGPAPAADTPAEAPKQRTTQQAAEDFQAAADAADKLRAKYVPLAAAQQQFMQQTDELDHLLKSGVINLREHGAALDTLKAGYQRSVSAMNQSGAAAASLNKNFGLASHQITNLGFQLNDLVVQIASGGGILIPLIQQGAQVQQILSMSEGGVGGVLTRVTAVLGRIGPLGWAAFGAAGLAGAVGISTIALVSHGAKLEENEAHLRAFSSRSSEIIAVSERLATTLGVSATGGFQTLADATIRWGQALGIVNVDAWITNFGRLALSGHATAASADAAAAAFAKLAAQGTITSGQLIEFVDKYPQFAQAIANALGVTRDQLKRLDADIEISSKRVATAISQQGEAAQANVRPWNQLSASVGTYYDALAKATSERWNASLDLLAQGIFNVIDAWKGAVDWIGKYIDKMLQLAGIKIEAPAVPSGGGGGTAPDAGSRTTWQDMLDAMNKNAESSSRTADNTESTSSNTEGVAKDEGIWRIYQNAEQVKARVAATETNTANTVSAVNSLGSRIGGGGGMGPIGTHHDMGEVGSGRTSGPSFSVDRNDPVFGGFVRVWENIGKYGGTIGSTYASSAPGGGQGMGKDYYAAGLDKQADATEDATKAIDDLSKAAGQATLDLDSLGAPIQTQIDALRGLQQTALSRTYKPDPYAEKNPEFFYNGETIFRESQDKIYMGLQTQITKLEGLQSTLAQLVTQGAYFPTAIVNAMKAAGFGDIAQQITNAFRSYPGAPASATPAPTAVQAGTTPGTGATTPVVTIAPGLNSLGGRSSVNR